MSVGTASPKDSSYLFFLLFMFGTQETKEGFIQDQQKGVDFSNVAINLRQKRFWVRIFEREAKLLSCYSHSARFDGAKQKT